MEHPISMTLVHPCMNEKAGVIEVSDLLGQQLHTLNRVAKNYCLIHLQLKPKYVIRTVS